MNKNKKAITPVVATALLLVVAVVAVLSFQTWFQTYQSSLNTKVEQQSGMNSLIDVEGIIGNGLYIKSDSANAFSMFKITDSKDNLMCQVKDGVKSDLKADTRLLMNFNDGNATDLSGYGNNGILNGGVNCSVDGIYKTGCEFDGSTGEINISKDNLNLNNTNQVTISAWIYPKSYNDSQSGLSSEIFRYGYAQSDVIDLRLISTGTFMMEIGNHSNGNFYQFNSTVNVSLNKWSNVIGIFDGNTGVGKLYLDGKPANLNSLGNFPKSAPISHFVKSTSDVGIGNLIGQSEHFNGIIDEVAIYSNVLTDLEVKSLYNIYKAKFYEQLLPVGIKEINVSSCNLQKGQVYNFIGFTNNQKVEQTTIKR